MTRFDQPAWLARAWADLGIAETPGDASNPRILAYYRDAGHEQISSDAVAWCAAFVGAVLKRSGHLPTGSLLARSYLAWGTALEAPRLGCLVVLSRGDDPGAGHVGFLVGHAGDRLILLGGNQSDAVSVEAFAMSRLLGYRWPAETAAPPDIFETALAHVLEMEGGWTDDPDDPGGPTHRGITLATYAAHRRIALTSATQAALRAELQRLDLATTRAIYRTRYWARCHAALLPPALALMHFDAAVNHGVAGAAKLLQETLGVEIDGEIGPVTLTVARQKPIAESLDRYAALRRTRYRLLPHYWRFGRGWERRVERTRARCDGLLDLPAPPLDLSQFKEPPMSDTDHAPASTITLPAPEQPKWWGHSLAIWGTLITALSTVLPVIGPLIGLPITAEMVRALGEGLTQVVQALGGVIGTILAIYGRARAVQPLVRRDLTLKL